MYRDEITIPNFDRIETAILGLPEDVGHLLLTDRSLSASDAFIAKTYLTTTDLKKYIVQSTETVIILESDNRHHHAQPMMSAMPNRSDNDDEDDDDELDLIAEGDSGTEDSICDAMNEDPDTEPTYPEFLRALVLWLKDHVNLATNDIPARSFLLRAYSPKGTRVVMTISFRAENRAWRPPPQRMVPVQEVAVDPAGPTNTVPRAAAAASSESVLRPPTPQTPQTALAPVAPSNLASPAAQAPAGMILMPANVGDGALYGTAGAFRALGDSYEHYGRLMIHGVGQLQDMMNQVLRDMGKELHGARGHVTSLVEDVLDRRVREVEIREEHAESTNQTDQRMALAREAFGQFGMLAQSFFAARGIPPELAEVYGVISSSPELMGTLARPSVRALLQDPDNVKALAVSLEQIGAQQEQLREGSQGARALTPPTGPFPGPGYPAPPQLMAGGPMPYAAPPGSMPPSQTGWPAPHRPMPGPHQTWQQPSQQPYGLPQGTPPGYAPGQVPAQGYFSAPQVGQQMPNPGGYGPQATWAPAGPPPITPNVHPQGYPQYAQHGGGTEPAGQWPPQAPSGTPVQPMMPGPSGYGGGAFPGGPMSPPMASHTRSATSQEGAPDSRPGGGQRSS